MAQDLLDTTLSSKPILGVLFQEPVNKIFTVLGHHNLVALLIWEVYGLLLDQLVHFGVILRARVEGWEPNNHLIGEDTEGPPIDWEGVTTLHEDLWSQVVWSTAEGVGLSVSFEHLGKSEISQTDVSILVHQDIFWLKISVDDLFAVEMTQSHSNLDCIELCPILWESGHLTQVGEELSSSHESHDKEDLLVGLEHVAHTNEEWMVGLQEDIFLQFGRLDLVILNNDILAERLHGEDLI